MTSEPVEVVLEAFTGTPRQWRRVGGVSEPEPLGSISWSEAAGRQVYLFGFRDGRPGVWRSADGVDVANTAVREVITTGLVPVSDLAEPHELPSDGGRQVRFRLSGPAPLPFRHRRTRW